MKVKQNLTIAAMALTLVTGVALATAADTTATGSQRGPGYGMMMHGQGPHHGARGNGGCGKSMKGMMNGNQDCGMANCGQRMGRKGMMGGGPGMHHGATMNPEMREKRNQFLDSTVELRKQMHDKRFAYMEAQRNPDLTQGELQKQADELFALRQQLQTKRQAIFATETKE